MDARLKAAIRKFNGGFDGTDAQYSALWAMMQDDTRAEIRKEAYGDTGDTGRGDGVHDSAATEDSAGRADAVPGEDSDGA